MDKLLLLKREPVLANQKTQMEREAIRAAREPLYKALTAIGPQFAGHFDQCTAAQMDAVIEAVWDGCRASMQLQSNRGEVPF